MNRLLLLFGVALVALSVCSESEAAVPVLNDPVPIQYAGSTLDMGSHAAVDFTDWDNDGRMDMVAGWWWSSTIRLYPNSGTSNAPVFNTRSTLQAGGSNIVVYGY